MIHQSVFVIGEPQVPGKNFLGTGKGGWEANSASWLSQDWLLSGPHGAANQPKLQSSPIAITVLLGPAQLWDFAEKEKRIQEVGNCQMEVGLE